MDKTRIRYHVRLDPELSERVERLRQAAGLDGAVPNENRFLAALVKRGTESVEREHGLEPTKAAA